MKLRVILSVLFMLPASAIAAQNYDPNVMFDVSERKAMLQEDAYADIKNACMQPGLDTLEIPSPIASLSSTDSYGTDNAAQPFSWFVMLHAAHALAGDEKASAALAAVLKNWADAGALIESDSEHDTYYALKRAMLPTVVALGIIADDMEEASRDKVIRWMDKVILPLDKHYGGKDVDQNNHRMLADSLQMAWGAFKKDDALLQKGIDGYKRVLEHARKNGSLPLETRRGARANWYMRQSLASMVVMAEIAEMHGASLYPVKAETVDVHRIMDYYLRSLSNPMFVMPYATQNHIPGKSPNFFQQDDGMLEQRAHGRHYMAFAEAYKSRFSDRFEGKRLAARMQEMLQERPFIDEFSGGNLTCFFAQPEATK